ncbi:hypothetical protein [Pelomonas sp. SE-A7]|uniref:hypothetical protein n=1 Tax=Pelomonas sp. SE-A7 TaxID=3054953 RepID=UPI00259C742E|nr:hypothetical protein [Pelomonas sp. SE-A7]MDM4767240.1 hypothetical protein [Pelomonas sp. SE-A7]
MHLMIPHASAAGEAAEAALQTLVLPRLAALLGLLQGQAGLEGSAASLNTPHEKALAQALGWPALPDGCLPLAARAAAADGIDVGEHSWALLSPMHLQVSADQIAALEPAALNLSEAESRQLLDDLAVALFPADEGWRHAWGAPDRWFVAHASLAGLASASLERVVNRGVDPWMPEARALRTLQNECQMVLHRHPLNEQREARGELMVNTVWISGCGAALGGSLPAGLQIDERLVQPLLAGDWPSWCDAWKALDAGPIAELLDRARRGEAVALTLCGESEAREFHPQTRSTWQRLWNALSAPRVDAPALLASLSRS